MAERQNKEKGYGCPNCEEEKPEYREPCPECGYDDKKIEGIEKK